MIKKVLEIGKQTIVLEGLERPQFLIFGTVSSGTTIKAEIQRVGKDNVKLITPILLTKLHEAQQKIKVLQNVGHNIVPYIDYSDTNIAKNLIVQLSLGGEIAFDDVNDKIIITLDNMVVGGDMFVLGSSSTSQTYYRFLDQIYEGKHNEMRLDVAKFDYLVFDADGTKFPQLIEKFYESDVDREDFEQVRLKERLIHGIVCFSTLDLEEASIDLPVYGSNKSFVVDVRGLQTLLLKDDRGNDYNFHGVKFQ